MPGCRHRYRPLDFVFVGRLENSFVTSIGRESTLVHDQTYGAVVRPEKADPVSTVAADVRREHPREKDGLRYKIGLRKERESKAKKSKEKKRRRSTPTHTKESTHMPTCPVVSLG
jgi:hypothetical protein